jgi:glycosyltransferase involved in cell wall biosynthesis
MTNLKQKKLALHFHIPITIKHDGYYYPEYYGNWIDSLAPHFKEIVFLTYSNKKSDENKYKVTSSNVSLIDLGDKPILRNTIINHKKYQNILKNNLNKFDIVMYRAPTPLAVFFYPITKDKVNVFFLVANMLKGLDSAKSKISFVKYYLWKKYWTWDHNWLEKNANKSLTLSNGPTFLKEFNCILDQKVIFTSTIHSSDVQEDKKNKALQDPVQLLYLGRISSEKSIDTLIMAIDILGRRRIKLELNIVGSGDVIVENELKELVSKLKIKNINFFGHKAIKEDIENIMDKNDIFIIPSSWDWQPRTMWEAMARGLPIICSKGVKSPSLLFKHEKDMLFTEIKDSVDMANNIQSLIEDNKLREDLIHRSLQIASKRTIGRSSKLQVKNILEYIENA